MNTTVDYIEASFLLEQYIGYGKTPKNPSATGYGNKIPTHRTILCQDGRTRRVYAICHSNVASHYIIVKGQDRFIRDCDLT